MENGKTGAMRETTRRKYMRIRERFNQLAGTDSVMNLYYQIASEFDMSVERIRQIIAISRHKW